MICLNCENETQFEEKELPVLQCFHGQEFRVESPVTVCVMCGFELLTIKTLQMGEFGQDNELFREAESVCAAIEEQPQQQKGQKDE